MMMLARVDFDYAGRDPFGVEFMRPLRNCFCSDCISGRFWGQRRDPIRQDERLAPPLQAAYLLLEQRFDMWPENWGEAW